MNDMEKENKDMMKNDLLTCLLMCQGKKRVFRLWRDCDSEHENFSPSFTVGARAHQCTEFRIRENRGLTTRMQETQFSSFPLGRYNI